MLRKIKAWLGRHKNFKLVCIKDSLLQQKIEAIRSGITVEVKHSVELSHFTGGLDISHICQGADGRIYVTGTVSTESLLNVLDIACTEEAAKSPEYQDFIINAHVYGLSSALEPGVNSDDMCYDILSSDEGFSQNDKKDSFNNLFKEDPNKCLN